MSDRLGDWIVNAIGLCVVVAIVSLVVWAAISAHNYKPPPHGHRWQTLHIDSGIAIRMCSAGHVQVADWLVDEHYDIDALVWVDVEEQSVGDRP